MKIKQSTPTRVSINAARQLSLKTITVKNRLYGQKNEPATIAAAKYAVHWRPDDMLAEEQQYAIIYPSGIPPERMKK